MKPIIIKVDKDDNIVMKLEEFQKHMDDAYYQGVRDGDRRNDWWWYTHQSAPVPVYKTTITGTEGSTIDAKSVYTAGPTTTTATLNTPTK